jgi:hypothetical protein
MNVTETEKRGQPEFRHSLALTEIPVMPHKQPMPKQPTARMKIINGRPYYYAITNVWDLGKQCCHQKSKYLGKELPKGYRLVK